LSDQLRNEAEKRATAEERARQIPELQLIIGEQKNSIQSLNEKINDLKLARKQLETSLEAERKIINEQKANFENAKKSLVDTFKALSSDTLKENSQTFLQMASQRFDQAAGTAKMDLEKKHEEIESAVKPITLALEKVDAKIGELEKARLFAYSGITEQFKNMKETNEKLMLETANLVKALRTPHIRGRWAELQLRRVVEMAGMVKHCDFAEQVSVETEETDLRPDVVVSLPGGKCIVVDSKAVITAYIESTQTDDEQVRKAKLQEHARHVKARVADLSKKKYWDQFENSPDFVILYLPGEAFYSAALDIDPSLMEQSIDQKVVIATPMTLIALLKAAAYGWNQDALAENAKQISELGKDLHKRMSDMAGHFWDLGSKLGGAVTSYNKAIGSLESRVLPTTRKFYQLKAVNDQDENIESLMPIETNPREIQAPEMKAVGGQDDDSSDE
jgi:DNA recombination protein RmuC